MSGTDRPGLTRRVLVGGLGAGIALPALLRAGRAAAAEVTVPSPSGGDDTSAIQAAVTAAGVGGTVRFALGTYQVSSSLSARADQTWLGGTASAAGTTLHALNPHFAMVVATGGVHLRGLTLDLDRDAHPTPTNPSLRTGVVVRASATGAAATSLTSCRIAGANGRGIDLDANGAAAGQAVLNTSDLVVENCGSHGIQIRNATGGTLQTTTVTGCLNGIWCGYSSGIRVEGATVSGAQAHGVVVMYSSGWTVSGSTCTGNGQWGICAGGIFEDPPVSRPNHDYTIAHNISTDNGNGGITLDPTVQQYPTTIHDQQAVVEFNTCSGSAVPTSIHGINITHASHVTVRNNLCHDNPNTGIQISSSGQITATGNECHHNDYGLRVSAGNVVGGGGHTVADNNLHDNRIADLQL